MTRDAVSSLHAKALELERLALEMTAAAGSGHPTSAASLTHLVTALLYRHMRWDPAEPDHPASDRLVLSEGHAVPIVYAAAADLGVAIGRHERRAMTREDALTLRAIDSPIDGHPNPVEGFPFFPAATGSLGQGLSVALGLALAARLDGIAKRVFCLIGDGESREGQIWEALDFQIEHDVRAACPIFNANGQGQTGPVSAQQSPEALARKLDAFGFEAIVLDGHDPEAVLDALARHAERADGARGRPVALVARTVKGWCMPSIAEKRAGMHGKAVEGEELERALAELDGCAERVSARWTEGALERAPFRVPAEARRDGGRDGRKGARPLAELPDLAGALRDLGRGSEAGGELAPREGYGLALRVLGHARADVVALDGDVSNSTHAELFARDPELAERFFECRIAEQNMVSCAAGLSAAGKVPFVSTFGKFLTRAYDQIEMALISGLALRLVGSHVGVTPASDGPSQMALPDAAWFASLARVQRENRPLLHVLTPSDAACAYALTLEMAYHDRTTYLRTLRPAVPDLSAPDERFRIGGHRVLREGSDLALLAWGYEVHECLAAAVELGQQGIEAAVVDLYSLPFDEAAIVQLVHDCSGRAITVEDNFGGALGCAVTEVVVDAPQRVRVEQMYVRDVPKSGREPEDVLRLVGLTRVEIVRRARELVGA